MGHWVIEEVARDPKRMEGCSLCGEEFPETELRQRARPIGDGTLCELLELCDLCSSARAGGEG